MLHGWCHVKCCRFSTSSVYTIQPCTRLQCHFIQSHIGRVYVCLAVTCHLHFWQNDWDLLRATAVTWGWNGYRNKSQHRKLTLEKKILPQLLPGLEPGTFWSWVRRSNHWAIPAPQYNTIQINTNYCDAKIKTVTCKSSCDISPLLPLPHCWSQQYVLVTVKQVQFRDTERFLPWKIYKNNNTHPRWVFSFSHSRHQNSLQTWNGQLLCGFTYSIGSGRVFCPKGGIFRLR